MRRNLLSHRHKGPSSAPGLHSGPHNERPGNLQVPSMELLRSGAVLAPSPWNGEKGLGQRRAIMAEKDSSTKLSARTASDQASENEHPRRSPNSMNQNKP